MGKLFKGLLLLVLVLGVIAAGAWYAMRKPDVSYATLENRYAGTTSRYQELPGGLRVRYRDQGKADGPVIVLVHGFYASLDTWEPWVADLGKDYRIVTLDLPGHGLTQAPQGFPMSVETYVTMLEAFAKARGLDKFVLGGSSMGGNVAWRYALAHPERMRGLILVGSGGWPTPAPSAEMQRMLDALENPAGRFALRDLDNSAQLKKGIQAAYAKPDRVSEATVQRFVDFSRAPGHRDAMIDLMLSFERLKPATRERLAMIAVPTLVLHGAKDGITPPADSRRFAEAIPGAKLIVYQDAGHILQEDAATASAADVRAFMGSLEPKKAEPQKPVHDNKGKLAEEGRDPNAVIFY